MPKKQWGSPEHWVVCPGCDEQMKWGMTTSEDTRVIGFVTHHGCMECGERKQMLLDNDLNVLAVYSEPVVQNVMDWYDAWDNHGQWQR